MNRVLLNAADLDGYLTEGDRRNLQSLEKTYEEAGRIFQALSKEHRFDEGSEGRHISTTGDTSKRLISLYHEMGNTMERIIGGEPRISVYPWQTPPVTHGEVSRLIAKLRDITTGRHEFIYYIQRAYELLFNLAYGSINEQRRNHLIVRTPITHPVQNFAVHRIPHIDQVIDNVVMCVMLRGALLPSMIMSKEIQEYSSTGYVPPFALFKVSRNDEKAESNMEYILDLDRSYFDLEALDGRDLIFADPMNATGGSLVTIVTYLTNSGVKPKSILFFNVIAAMKGSLRIVRALDRAIVYTLWMDPVLNSKAYILPGLGDAGDRINGPDDPLHARDIIQLIAEYGSTITSLYRSQVKKIEETVLGTHGQ
jgi:uracil phosphoribosyltransferase